MFHEVDINTLNVNPFKMIGKQWMLITSGNEQKFNTMTASWGGLGVLWNKNVTFSFIRPQRYTFEFMENNKLYTLSFYEEKYRNALGVCGKISGRDNDKPQIAGLTPVFDNQSIYFSEASMVLVCRKIHSQFLDPSCFIDEGIKKNYDNEDYHKVYVGEIIKVLMKD